MRGTETESAPEPQSPWRRAMLHVRGIVSGPPLEPGLDVTVHLHPDRPMGEVLVLRHLTADGLSRSRFETGSSNGGLTAHPGAERWAWEHTMFAGAYDDAPAAQRPKYGSLDHRRRSAGGSVRSGSSYLRLAPHVLARTTFCYPDGHPEHDALGTAEHMSLAGLPDPDAVDPFDDSVEAHVHGALRLNRDISALVLDPSFRGGPVEEAASALPFPVEWHHGFVLSVDGLAAHAEYRGAEVVAVGREVAEDGVLDARIIGDAVRAGAHDPQVLERVWHCTARFGSPARA